VSDGAEFLSQGVEALVSGDIDGAIAALTSAVEVADLPTARLYLGALGYADENFDESRRQWETAFRSFRDADDLRGAALAATYLAGLHYDVFGNEAASRGWLSRAARLLDRAGRCVERGYYELALVACNVRDISALEESAAVALDLAIEFNDPDLEARALADGGLALISQGRLASGFARLDEAMAPVSAGEVRSPMIAGTVYCALLTACERTGELRRAEEWTRAARDFAARRMSGRLPILHAHCRLAYGTVLCDAGRWPEAETELVDALGPSSTESIPKMAEAAGALASLRLMQDRVEEAADLLAPYADRFEVCLPLARLHFARGELDLAAVVIARALAELVGDRLRAGRLLRLLVDVELARGETDAAARSAERLADYADESDSPVLHAESKLADGRVAIAGADPGVAIDAFEAGIAALAGEERPILAATLRLELAEALAAKGNDASSVDEARTALTTLERLRAAREIERAVALLERLTPATPART
jgi:hypothetical protein